MTVLEPLKVIIANFPHSGTTDISVPNFPADPSKGHHVAKLADTIYIEQADFVKV